MNYINPIYIELMECIWVSLKPKNIYKEACSGLIYQTTTPSHRPQNEI